ncbi:hypothetical protein [uncultured Psychroserpens sp.]|uniref:hypothetical protein n=1 Tax=uncultured Psychroserpens sp. TaxID=255436 RepID=UPI0026204A39|nr:hypothetical protein [uncultured Psychroserpens sp.]
MKNTLKIASLFAFVLFAFNSCDDSEGENEGKFDDNPEAGWVQFQTSASQISLDAFDFTTPFTIPVEVNVPVVPNDLRISYSLESVSGANPNMVFSNSGSIINPGGTSSHFDLNFPEIEFDMSEALSAGISEPMVFDVVLESTDKASVAVGIFGSDRPTSYRITVCPSFASSTGAFIGDYTLTVPTGNGAFGEAIFADGQTVTLTEGDDGEFSRKFTTVYLPAFQADTMEVTFSFVGGTVAIGSGLNTDIGCGGFILIGGDAANTVAQPCDDSSLMLNMLDFEGGSGGCGPADLPFTVMLTKI